ncbi:MAG: hypothetical protein R3293_28335, partial [Candidatus Promineifilaceae bacterium]|nr:hypothetical protein [Candidatus Promineifilaceae bacterium]
QMGWFLTGQRYQRDLAVAAAAALSSCQALPKCLATLGLTGGVAGVSIGTRRYPLSQRMH